MSANQFDPRAYVRQLTSRPGVYRMLDAGGGVLYIGKAKNLKKRVSSYFLRASGNPKTEAMVDQIAGIEVTVTDTEDEALVLESTLIKKHRPRYNVFLRDDKSYPYLFISGDHDFPRMAYHRGAHKREGHYFGPFPNSGAVRQTQNTIHKLFKLRNCDDSFFANRSRPCLQYQIKRCSAPCVGYIDRAEYVRDVADAVDLLKGRDERLVERLIGEMEDAAQRLEFEQAARIRGKIAAVRRLQEQARATGGNADCDLVCAAAAGNTAAVVVVSVRGGLHLGHRGYFPTMPRGTNESELIEAFLGQYYLERKPPREVVVEPLPAEREWLAESLSRRAGRKVTLKHRVRGYRARWLENARATLQQTLDSRLASRAGVQSRLIDLQTVLDMPAPPMRMECFDISHTRGERPVASCVVFQEGAPQNSDYRRFNIGGVEPGDDYAALGQALQRRFQRLQRGEAPLPDLLLIDGGRGQLRVALDTLAEIGVDDVPVVAVAKGARRKPGQERLFLPGRGSPLILPSDSGALHLVQHIRDEAHRFAIGGHRGRRAKARQGSELDEIGGLGPVRRKKLLRAFGGARQVARAGVRDLARIEGISTAMAQRIYDHFHES
jgi:excinuclease ABC subunit C